MESIRGPASQRGEKLRGRRGEGRPGQTFHWLGQGRRQGAASAQPPATRRKQQRRVDGAVARAASTEAGQVPALTRSESRSRKGAAAASSHSEVAVSLRSCFLFEGVLQIRPSKLTSLSSSGTSRQQGQTEARDQLMPSSVTGTGTVALSRTISDFIGTVIIRTRTGRARGRASLQDLVVVAPARVRALPHAHCLFGVNLRTQHPAPQPAARHSRPHFAPQLFAA
mmetsp:Transcript_693/g.1631  ORF Transcript_693/g.1631 Transcript_693/m.1631 type:complete len:225 (+) Transcript_693:296-970(+)